MSMLFLAQSQKFQFDDKSYDPKSCDLAECGGNRMISTLLNRMSAVRSQFLLHPSLMMPLGDFGRCHDLGLLGTVEWWQVLSTSNS